MYSFFNLSARWISVVNATPRPIYLREWPIPIVLTGAENLATTGIRSPTVLPVASRYTYWAIPAHDRLKCTFKADSHIAWCVHATPMPFHAVR